MPKPIIGVTGPDTGGVAAWLFTRWAVQRSGGIARRITPSGPAPREALDALVIGGGADVTDPERWSEPSVVGAGIPPRLPAQSSWRRATELVLAPVVYAVRRLGSRRVDTFDPSRDELERGLLAHAAAEELPVLGICRGAQLMNVCAGGSLHRDLTGFYGEEPLPWTVLPRRRIAIHPDSRLASVLRVRSCRVNGLHRHAVDGIGQGLRVVARARSGMPQAIEHGSRRFWIGVQWHPEYLPQLAEQRRLFDALVAEAAEHRATREPMSSRPRAWLH